MVVVVRLARVVLIMSQVALAMWRAIQTAKEGKVAIWWVVAAVLNRRD